MAGLYAARAQLECRGNLTADLQEYIVATEPSITSLSSPLSAFGWPSLESLLDSVNGSLLTFWTGGIPLLIVSVLLLLILLYFLIVTIMGLGGLCNMVWAKATGKSLGYRGGNKIEKAYRFRTSFFARKLSILKVLFLCITILYVAAVVVAVLYAAYAYNGVQPLRCHSAFVRSEIETGVAVTSVQRGPDWMGPVPENATFKGISNFELERSNVFMLNTTAEAYFTNLIAYQQGAIAAMTPIRDIITNISMVKEGTNQSQFGCVGTRLLDDPMIAEATSHVESVVNLGENFTDAIIGNRSETINSIYSWNSNMDILKKVAKGIDYVLDWYWNASPDPLSVTPIILLVFLTLAIATIAFLAILFIKSWAHAHKNTSADADLYAKLFGSVWVVCAVLGILAIVANVFLLMWTSFASSACSFARQIPKDKDMFQNYELTRQFMSEPARVNFYDRCVVEHSSNSTLLNVMVPSLIPYLTLLDNYRASIWEDNLAYFGSVSALEASDVYNQLSIFQDAVYLNITDDTLMVSDNLLFLPNAFFGAIVKLRPNTTRLGKQYTVQEGIDEVLAKRRDLKLAYMANMSAEDTSSLCMTATPVPYTDVYPLATLLGDIQKGLSGCLGVARSPLVFCLALKGQDYCAGPVTTGLTAYSISANSIIDYPTDKPFWESKFEGYTAEPVLETYLAQCKARYANATNAQSCLGYHINSVYSGVYMLQQWKQGDWSCECNRTAARSAAGLSDVGLSIVQSFTGPSVYSDGEGGVAFQGVVSPLKYSETLLPNTYNCAVLSNLIGELTEHVCASFQPYVVVFICFAVLACCAVISWVLTYHAYLYFLRAQLLTKRARRIKDAENPAQWLELISKNVDDKEVLYDVMDDSPVSPYEAQNELDSRVLHYAAYSGDRKTVKTLLDGGADIDARNARGYTPLAVAVSEGHADVAELLIQRGAKVHVRDEFGETPLHAAARAGDFECVKVLCQSGLESPTFRNNVSALFVHGQSCVLCRMTNSLLTSLKDKVITKCRISLLRSRPDIESHQVDPMKLSPPLLSAFVEPSSFFKTG